MDCFKYRLPVVFALLAGVVFSSCSMPLAVGKLTEVMILAEEEVWGEVESDIRLALERQISSPRRETTFRVLHAGPDEPGEYRKWSKIVLIGSLEKSGWIRQLIPEEVAEEVEAEGGLIYTVADLWAQNQWAFILVTAKSGDIQRYVKHSGNLLFSQLDRLLRAQVRERMFMSGEDLEREEELQETYGFSLHLPAVYRTDESLDSARVLRFSNVNPQRSIFVYWEDSPWDSLDSASILQKRMEISEFYYPGDSLVEGELKEERVDFQGRPALKLMGQWENRVEIEGGTFTAYAFNCPESNRFYLLDAVLFAPNPKKAKYTYLIQIETILESFSCASRNVNEN